MRHPELTIRTLSRALPERLCPHLTTHSQGCRLTGNPDAPALRQIRPKGGVKLIQNPFAELSREFCPVSRPGDFIPGRSHHANSTKFVRCAPVQIEFGRWQVTKVRSGLRWVLTTIRSWQLINALLN